MAHNLFKSAILIYLISLTVLFTRQTIPAANAAVPGLPKGENEVGGETVEVSENPESDQIDSFLATLSDAQVRRLLIQELKEEAERELSEGVTEEEVGGLAGLIQKFKFISNFVQWRLYELKSGASADPENLPKFYRLLGKGEADKKPDAFKTIASVVAVLSDGSHRSPTSAGGHLSCRFFDCHGGSIDFTIFPGP